jgi:hypothetical protein
MPSLKPVVSLGAGALGAVEKRIAAKVGSTLLKGAIQAESKVIAKTLPTVLKEADQVVMNSRFGVVGKMTGWVPKPKKFVEVKGEVIGFGGIRQGKNGSVHQYVQIRVHEVVGKAVPGAAKHVASGSTAVSGRAVAGVASQHGVTGTIQPGAKLMISHNISVAQKVPLQRGDLVSIKGMPFYNASGAVKGMHWTHHARQPDDAGWIKLLATGLRYQ